MTTETDICRLALDHIGAESIASLDESSPEAQYCRRLYPVCRDQVLRDYPWVFAERRKLLAVVTLNDTYGFEYAYQYPPDCLRAISIHQDAAADPVPFKVINAGDATGKIILTDQEAAVLVYTFKCTNPGVFDSAFITALAYRLAADLAMPVTRKPVLAETMTRSYRMHIAAAGSADAMEGHEKKTNRFESFIEARY